MGSIPIRVAHLFKEEQLHKSHGILAQLGEHLPYKQRVTGSSPVGPILADVAQLAEQLICNQQVNGSSPFIGLCTFTVHMGGFPSGQRGQTVNLLQFCFDGSNPSPPIQYICRCGGTGRRTGLKILRDLYSRTGSIPVTGIYILLLLSKAYALGFFYFKAKLWFESRSIWHC